jgi:TPR repeat protein
MLIEGSGGPKDEVESRRLYGLAAAQGHAVAQYGLAHMLDLGLGGPKDEVEARRLLGLATAQGATEAQYRLADMLYTKGRGGPRDEVEAQRLWLASRPRRDMLTRRAYSR